MSIEEYLARRSISPNKREPSPGDKPTGNPESYLAEGVTCGQLSGGQKHLIYLLGVLASRPRVRVRVRVRGRG